MRVLIICVLFISLGLCISCDLGLGIHEPTELEKLPPLTTTGENTFGCLVNGEAFVVTNTSQQVAIFQQGQLQFGGNIDKDDLDEGLSILIGDPIETNKTYIYAMEPSFFMRYYLRTSASNCRYEVEDTYKGSITFTKIDRTNLIISGTFEFSTVTAGCDTVKITDGRFDMQYIP
ncbi:hypothetical protein [Marinoscillum luteum]|uniref:Lipocalin-like domain-containing protein n=1 Tax=Marinoscillum luteum TaxID=861051 RepID=A0ABW7NF05_9BACT